MAKLKCSAAWGTRYCVVCYRFMKRYDQNCVPLKARADSARREPDAEGKRDE